MVPENIHTHPTDGHWKFQRSWGGQKPIFLKENMKLNWNFQRGGVVGGGLQNKKTSMGEVWIFFGTTQC